MNEASAFVILRDDDAVSRACFPFRLSGFLQTGKPVILSAVGEVCHLFQHRRDAWIIPVGDASEPLADALIHLAANPSEARNIGIAGSETGRRELRYDHQGERVSKFLESLVARGGSSLSDS
jgi:glycosyltransferase involved in cell wall biosynthesis